MIYNDRTVTDGSGQLPEPFRHTEPALWLRLYSYWPALLACEAVLIGLVS